MATGPTISMQKILAASQGNPDLREVLDAVNQVAGQTQVVTSTTPIAGNTAGQPNSAAARPAQATGSVSILKGSYIVQLVNPGGQSAISQLQSAQQAQNATAQTSVQPVTPIYHQIRVSTSRAFNVNSNTQTFGGDTGQTQTYWTLTGLGTGTWYIQFRSSFDGVNWNSWKNANSGNALGGLVNQVTTETSGSAVWALLTLPGGAILGIGAEEVTDYGIFGLAEELYSSEMVAITGPNGFPSQNNGVYGMAYSDVNLETPTSGSATGILDYPVQIRSAFAIYGGTTVAPSNASVFAIALNYSANDNVTVYSQGGSTPTTKASWMVLRLPGGARIALGQGRNNHGETIWTPPGVPWINSARCMSICSLTAVTPSGNTISGYNANKLSGFTVEAQWLDLYNNVINGTANWMAIAWEVGAPVAMVGGFPFLTIQLQGGHAMVIGAGQVASGTAVTLPAGYGSTDMLSICTPGSCDLSTGDNLRGVEQCSFDGLVPVLTYTDNSHVWSGNINWFLGAWR